MHTLYAFLYYFFFFGTEWDTFGFFFRSGYSDTHEPYEIIFALTFLSKCQFFGNTGFSSN